MTTSPKKILITGIHGFTGRYLVPELKNSGHEIFGLGMHTHGDSNYFQADLRDVSDLIAAVKTINPHWVVHLAGISFVGHKDPNDFYNINLMGTRNLLAALAEARLPPEKVILAGSANIYGNAFQNPITEDTPLNPANDYAVSKLAMEYMAGLWLSKLPVVITRPFNYTGIGQSSDFIIPKIVQHFKQKEPSIEMGNLDISRDFSDVRFVAKAYHKLLEKASPGEVVNICSGKATSLREILDQAASISGHELKVRTMPRYIRASEIKTLRGDPSKLRSILGEWNPPAIEETLAWMIEEEEK